MVGNMEIETCWRYYRSFGIRGTRLARISKLKHVGDTIVPQTFGERIEDEEKKENLVLISEQGFSEGRAVGIVVSFQRNPPPNICGRVFFSNQRKPYPNIWGRFWR